MEILNYYDWLLSVYLQPKKRNIVQIGANDGRINDPIYKWIMNHKKSTNILLVEPQPEVILFLQKNYSSHPNYVIANEAVGHDKNLKLYRLKPELWGMFIKRYLKNSPTYRVPTGFTSQIKNHVVNHIRNNLPPSVDERDAIEILYLPSSNLLSILQRHRFPEKIDLLQVDCEGADDKVLYSCDLHHTTPEIINFEYCHIPTSRMNNLVTYLEDLGYKVYSWSKSDATAISRSSIFNDNLSPFAIRKLVTNANQ
jgi:FkbM family methyltransferase